MNTNSNGYTIAYASIMVVIVAFLLAFVSSSLKETQNKNVEMDTKKQILAAIHVTDVKDADAEFKKYDVKDMLMEPNGTLVPYTGSFNTTFKGEIAENRLHVFECKVDGSTKYIIPVYGAGLWNAIWGYIALNEDRNTVYGVYFAHAGETPGLGADIATPKFQLQFDNKKVLEDGKVALSVVKPGRGENPEYDVDGISGGTITSQGVDAMLKNCLGAYNAFLTK